MNTANEPTGRDNVNVGDELIIRPSFLDKRKPELQECGWKPE